MTFIRIKEHLLQTIEPNLKALFERDAEDFEEVVQLRKIRNGHSDHNTRAQWARKANDKLQEATDNLFQIVDQCFKLVDYGVVAFTKGWTAVRGDSGAAISASIAGITAGLFIANLNLRDLRDRAYAKDKTARCGELYNLLTQKQQQAFKCVTSLNSEALDAIQLVQLELNMDPVALVAGDENEAAVQRALRFINFLHELLLALCEGMPNSLHEIVEFDRARRKTTSFTNQNGSCHHAI